MLRVIKYSVLTVAGIALGLAFGTTLGIILLFAMHG